MFSAFAFTGLLDLANGLAMPICATTIGAFFGRAIPRPTLRVRKTRPFERYEMPKAGARIRPVARWQDNGRRT